MTSINYKKQQGGLTRKRLYKKVYIYCVYVQRYIYMSACTYVYRYVQISVCMYACMYVHRTILTV